MTRILSGLLAAALAPLAAAAPQDYAQLERRHLPRDTGTIPPVGGKLADFDQDGDLDLLSGAVVHENLGAGRFAAGIFPGGGTPPGTVANAVGDWNGDGALDFAYAVGRQLLLYLGDGAGGFTPGRPAPSFSARILLPGDFDGDGDADLMVTEGYRQALFLNDGAGGFGTGITLWTYQPLSPLDVDAADLDGDGDLDLLATSGIQAGFGYTQVWTNDGRGRFTLQAGAAPNNPVSRAELADLDADGDQDVVVSAQLLTGDRRLRVLENQGGTFVDAGAVGPDDVESYEVFRLADVTGDGYTDLLWFGYRECEIWAGDGVLGFARATTASIPEGTDELNSVEIGDLDGDLDLDIVGSSVLRPHLLLNVDRGRFAAGVTDGLPRARVFTRRAYVGNTDFGGPASLLLLNSTGEGPVLFRPDRKGGFQRDGSLPILGKDASWALFEDVTGNGVSDIYIAFGAPGGSGGAGQDRYYRNTRGRWIDFTASALPAVVDTTVRVFAGDLDGDGRKDILKRVGNPSGYQILLQQSVLTFAIGGSVTGANDQNPTALADLDLDGDLDLVTNRQVFLNDGAANFVAAGAGWPVFPDVTFETVAADFDGDGDDDLFVLRSGYGVGGGQDLLFENRAGQLVDVTIGSIPVAVDQSITALAADLDQDGDLDLFVNRNESDKYLRNDGGLRFSVQPLGLPRSGRFGPGIQAIGDFDGDLDLDVLQSFRIASNLETQIHAPFLASIGARWEVELHASGPFGGGVAVVAVGPDRGFGQVVPGIQGTLRLDLANSGELGRVTLPATGSGSPAVLGVDVPLLPVLLGVDFAAQALYAAPGGALRFSNRISGELQ